VPPAPALGRAAELFVMVVLAWQILARGLDFNAASGALQFIHGIDLVIHEAGHTFAFFLPRFLYILAGSALQLILPAVCAVTFLRQGQPASFAVALFWTGESITDVAIYMRTRRRRRCPCWAARVSLTTGTTCSPSSTCSAPPTSSAASPGSSVSA
jgi:hypothetical protein